MQPADPVESLLVLRAQAGDVEAFGKLYDTVGPALVRYLVYLVGDREAAEDVAQSVFLKVYRKIGYLKDPSSFRPWIYRIAARQAFRTFRTRETQLTEEEWRQIHARASPPVERDILLDTARRRIADLPAASRAVLSLHYLEGLTLEDAAAVLGIPVGTAKSRLSFGIAKLRAWLGAGG